MLNEGGHLDHLVAFGIEGHHVDERPVPGSARPACRMGTRLMLITSQLPVTAWHAWLDEPTLADAILDRIVHGSHKIAFKGDSMRKLFKAA